MSRLRKSFLPFSWNPVAIIFTQGTSASINLASYLKNDRNYPITYSLIGTLQSGVTHSNGTVTYNGAGGAATTTVQFRATSGSYVADSAATVSIVATQVNRAPVWDTPSGSVGTFAATGGTRAVQLSATDPDGDPVTYSRTGSAADTAPGSFVVTYNGLLTIPENVAASTYTVEVRASDGLGGQAARQFTATVQAASTSTVKWYPGHYALTGVSSTAISRQSLAAEVAASGGWKGIHPRYFWGDLESSFGVYDFSSIRNDADYCQSIGMKLFIQLPWAKFNTSTPGNLLPSYAQSSAYGGGYCTSTALARCVLTVWNANLMSRLIALEEALAAWANDHPAVAGIVGGETALGNQNDLSPFGYTPSGTLTQYKRRIDSTSAVWTKTPAVFYSNFFSGWSSAQITDLFGYCAARKVGFGGPDILPNDPSLGQMEYMGQGGSPDYRGVVPIVNANQTQSVQGWSISQLVTYGISPLGSHFINTLYSVSTPVSTWSQIKAYVAANPNTVMTKPSVY